MTRHEYFEMASSSREYLELFKHTFGPMVAVFASLRGQPARAVELEAAFLQFVERWNRGGRGGRVQMPYEYLLVVAHKRDEPRGIVDRHP